MNLLSFPWFPNLKIRSLEAGVVCLQFQYPTFRLCEWRAVNSKSGNQRGVDPDLDWQDPDPALSRKNGSKFGPYQKQPGSQCDLIKQQPFFLSQYQLIKVSGSDLAEAGSGSTAPTQKSWKYIGFSPILIERPLRFSTFRFGQCTRSDMT